MESPSLSVRVCRVSPVFAILLPLLSVLCWSPSAVAAIDYGSLFHWSTRASFDSPLAAVAAEAGRTYVLRNGALEILDVTGHGAPRPLGHLAIPGTPRHLAVRNGLAYVCCWETDFRIINVADPSSPFVIGTVPSIQFAAKVVLEGSRAYVLERYYDEVNSVHVLDVSDPGSPVILGTFHRPYVGSVSLAVQKDLAYITDDFGSMSIVDFTIPSTPRLVSWTSVGQFAYGIAVVDSLAYVGYYFSRIPPEDSFGGVVRFDVSDPASPRLVTNHRMPRMYPFEIVPRDGRAYVTSFVGNQTKTRIFDLTQPGELPEIYEIWTFGSPISTALLEGGVCFARETSVEFYREGDLADPVLGEVLTPADGYMDIASISNRLYLPEYAGAIRC